jgi:hypothetical protein
MQQVGPADDISMNFNLRHDHRLWTIHHVSNPAVTARRTMLSTWNSSLRVCVVNGGSKVQVEDAYSIIYLKQRLPTRRCG